MNLSLRKRIELQLPLHIRSPWRRFYRWFDDAPSNLQRRREREKVAAARAAGITAPVAFPLPAHHVLPAAVTLTLREALFHGERHAEARR